MHTGQWVKCFLIDVPGHIYNVNMTTAVQNTASSTAGHTVTVIWTPPIVGGIPTSYNVSINNSSPVAIPAANGSTGPLMYTYTGLDSDTVYKVTIAAINCAGAGNTTTAMIRTCKLLHTYV